MITGSSTLRHFYQSYYRPVVLGQAAPRTFEAYEGALAHWDRFSGDPPISQITSQLISEFLTWLSQRRGKRPGSKMAANTIRMNHRHLQAVIDKLGQPGPRNRDAAGILKGSPPWARPPRREIKAPKRIKPEVLADLYRAAAYADSPVLDGIQAGHWWRGLIVFLYNTGVRIGAALELYDSDVLWNDAAVLMPARTSKIRREQMLHLNQTTLAHLMLVRGRDLLFDWPHHKTHLYTVWHQIQSEAGIPYSRYLGFHDLRRTNATELWKVSPSAAQLQLGHSSLRTTAESYVDAEMLKEAVENLPQPWVRKRMA